MAEWWDEYPDAAPMGAPSGLPPPTLYGDPEKPNVEAPGIAEGRELENKLKRQRLGKAEMSEGEAKLKESESTAAFLATNLVGNTNVLTKALKVDPSAARPTWGQLAAGLLGEDARNQVTPAQRQVVWNSQKLIVDAALTLGTGAAYTPVQIEAYTRGYFPQVGDTPEAIKAKRESLKVALMAARTKAGNAAPEIDKAMKALGLSSDPLADSAMPFDAFQKQLSAIFADQSKSPEDRLKAASALAAKAGRDINPDDAEAAAKAGAARVVDEPSGPSILKRPGLVRDFSESFNNIAGGIVEGAAALPDMAARTVGGLMALPVSAMGYEETANQLRNPITIGGAVARRVPPPQGALDTFNRYTGQFVGGVAGLPVRATSALAEMVVGKVPIAPVVNALTGRSVAAAGKRQGVDLLPADVGGEGVKAFTSAASQGPLSRGSIVKVARKGADQMQAAAGRAAVEAGRVLPEDEAGSRLSQGGVQYIKQVTDRASRWYDKANELAENIKIMPPKAIAVLDAEIAAKKEAGEIAAPMVEELEKVRRTLDQNGGITVTGMREARKLLGAMARNDKLRGTDAKRIFGAVLEAASDDMTTALVQAGKGDAARMFKRADTLWRERISTIDEVLEPIIGKTKSGEDVLRAVEGMARGSRGGVRRLERVMSVMPKDEKGDVLATVIDRMGRAKASAQDDVGGVFSSETFLTNWSGMTDKGKRALFGRGELRNNLDDIAKLAFARRGTQALSSKSNTPVGLTANLGAWAAAGTFSPQVAFVGAVAQYASGKLLASPRFTRWLARTPGNRAGIVRHITRLDSLAKALPVAANDIGWLKTELSKPLTATVMASESGSEGQNDE